MIGDEVGILSGLNELLVSIFQIKDFKEVVKYKPVRNLGLLPEVHLNR